MLIDIDYSTAFYYDDYMTKEGGADYGTAVRALSGCGLLGCRCCILRKQGCDSCIRCTVYEKALPRVYSWHCHHSRCYH